jgi:hypothetical protein
MATFGYTTQGTAGFAPLQDFIEGAVFTCPENGTGSSLTACLQIYSMGDATYVDIRLALYRHSDLALIAQTEKKTYTGTFAKQWVTFNFLTAPSLVAGTDYLLVATACSDYDTLFPTVRLYYDAGDVNQHHERSYTCAATSGYPTTLTAPTHSNYKDSIYCTYTPPVVKKPIMKMDLGPHPRSRLLFAPTLMLKGAGAPSVPPSLWDGWDYLWVAVL